MLSIVANMGTDVRGAVGCTGPRTTPGVCGVAHQRIVIDRAALLDGVKFVSNNQPVLTPTRAMPSESPPAVLTGVCMVPMCLALTDDPGPDATEGCREVEPGVDVALVPVVALGPPTASRDRRTTSKCPAEATAQARDTVH